MIPDINEVLKHYTEFTGIHEACAAVPMLAEDEFDALVADIKQNGLRHPLLRTQDGLLLDGRSRLLACYEAQQDIRIDDDPGICDPWMLVNTLNIQRRHLTVGQRAMFGQALREHYEALARQRQLSGIGADGSGGRGRRRRNLRVTGREGFGDTSDTVQVSSPEQSGRTCDQAGEAVGVSGSSIDRAALIVEYAPDLAPDVRSGELPLNTAAKEARRRRKRLQAKTADNPSSPPTAELVQVVTVDGKISEIAKPQTVRFNRTNDSVDWASWTWNPLTGCRHGCDFCYAREIANSQRMRDYYPNGFEPTFHEYRLDAPKNTPVPQSDHEQDGRVFVCSMADLFGKWVPAEWIRKVFAACMESPEWEYLFLTKWPARYAQMPLIENAWYGASVVQQVDVARVEKAMAKFSGQNVVKWISLEPMLQPIRFNDLSWCDLVVIGAQTATNQPDGFVPAFSPEFDWIVDVVNQCREFGVPYYLKANLGLEQPGMRLPKQSPRRTIAREQRVTEAAGGMVTGFAPTPRKRIRSAAPQRSVPSGAVI